MIMRLHLLKCIHEGHMGIDKSKAHVRACVYWPNMYSDIKQVTKQCAICNKINMQLQKLTKSNLYYHTLIQYIP